MQKIIVPEKYNNKKIITFLQDTYNSLSSSTIYKALRKKDIRINNIKISENTIIHTGDEITIYITDNLLFGESIKFETVYEDENILIINKPSGISVTENSNNEPTLTARLQEKYKSNSIMPCHRLDRNTSGLIIYAKNENALSILLNAFKNNEINKYYKCTVYGKMEKQEDTLTAYLFKDNKQSKVYISKEPKNGYRQIITHYKLLKYDKGNNTSNLEVKLETRKDSSNKSTFS